MANISQVYLLNVPLEDDMKNTLYFANATSQHNYFSSNIGRTLVTKVKQELLGVQTK